uniref:Neprosin PEP catalytic domain-containing protein n=1 Tax=Solanum tuberosum TaxID=4113 RepID=M1AWD1_SOLTU
MATSLYNPHVEGQQHSACRIKIQNGSDILQVGWRDTGIGNWWLLLGPDYTQVGFWPHDILNELKGFATNVDWGGVTYNPPGLPEPPMGSSFFPFGNSSFDAYCRNIAVSNENGDSVGVYNIVELTENKFAYDIQFVGLTEGSNTFTYVFYGGPGISDP